MNRRTGWRPALFTLSERNESKGAVSGVEVVEGIRVQKISVFFMRYMALPPTDIPTKNETKVFYLVGF